MCCAAHVLATRGWFELGSLESVHCVWAAFGWLCSAAFPVQPVQGFVLALFVYSQARLPLGFGLAGPVGRPLVRGCAAAACMCRSAKQPVVSSHTDISHSESRAIQAGRYPRHSWPEDPLTATPPSGFSTLKSKIKTPAGGEAADTKPTPTARGKKKGGRRR